MMQAVTGGQAQGCWVLCLSVLQVQVPVRVRIPVQTESCPVRCAVLRYAVEVCWAVILGLVTSVLETGMYFCPECGLEKEQ
jgi:hypothetical protein